MNKKFSDIRKAIMKYGMENVLLVGAGNDPWALPVNKDLELISIQRDIDAGRAKIYINYQELI